MVQDLPADATARDPALLARVVIAAESGAVEQLTYAVPDALADRVTAGHRVLVPLRSRRVTGIVLEVSAGLSTGGTPPKPILELLEGRPLFDQPHLELIQFLASYYMTTLGEAYRSVIPATARVESRRLFHPGELPSPLAAATLAPLESEILAALTRRPHTLRELRRLDEARDATPRTVEAALSRLAAAGLAEVRDGTRGRHRRPRAAAVPALDEVADSQSSMTLTIDREPTIEQAAAIAAVTPAVTNSRFESFLLWGITGSGKTEVYVRLAAEALEAGRQVLILVPEIALADQVVQAFQVRFGALAAVVHSAQNVAERWAGWMAALGGACRVIIGPRSAIFVPLHNLGLIVVDEEHDAAYKQEEGIRYHARDLAVMLARLSNCPIVLGSATPSAESYANARRGRYRMLRMTTRVADRALAAVELLDLREHLPSRANPEAPDKPPEDGPAPVPLAPRLIEALRANLAEGGQSMVFLNRRGFHNFLQCRLCGTVITCANCSVSLTFHLRDRTLRCHYCGANQAAPERCHECGGLGLDGQGFGTERLAETLAELLPDARIARMDSDTTRQRSARSAVVEALRRGTLDLVVGTQMITKGFDFPNVTLVAVVLADMALNMPDFRAAERTFQLLTQVAGRAGRGERPGRVLIQTYAPHHYSIRAARDQDFARFMRRELGLRQELGYPPFGRMALVRIEGADSTLVGRAAGEVAAALARHAQPDSLRVLGPAPAPLERLRGRFRWQVVVKSPRLDQLRAGLAALRAQLGSGNSRTPVRITIDLDPVNMM